MDQAGQGEAVWQAVCRSAAVVEFDPAGHILWANPMFCDVMGYSLDLLIGQHHRMFCTAADVAAPAYAAFWQDLRRGQFAAGDFKRIGRDGCRRPVSSRRRWNGRRPSFGTGWRNWASSSLPSAISRPRPICWR